MLPCAYKSILGIDCPFCGAQRSFYLMAEGRFTESLLMFPALVPVLVCAVISVLYLVNKNWVSAMFLRRFSVFVLCFVMIAYLLKITGVLRPPGE